MNAFTRTFGSASVGPLLTLASALSPLTPDSVAVVEHVLRFTAIPWDQGAAISGAVNAATLIISLDQYILWLQRFGAEGDGVAYANARALFSVGGATDSVYLQPWYHGLTAASAGVAQTLLAGKGHGAFLVRISASVAGSFAASYVVELGEVRHTRIHREVGGYKCDGRPTMLYPTLAQVVAALSGALATPVASALSQASHKSLLAPAAPADVDAYGSIDDTVKNLPAAPPALSNRSSSTSSAGAGAAAAITPSSTSRLAPDAAEPSFDVMISYQWDDQATVLKIKSALEALGVSVWMDLANMGAGYADQMVKAVRRSRCIVLCASHKYIRSANCEVEVKLVFEFRKEKKYVIVNFDADFYPGRCDHTLAALSAGNLYCDFTGARASAAGFDRGMADLRRQLIEHGILLPAALVAATARVVTAATSGLPPLRTAVSMNSEPDADRSGAAAATASASSLLGLPPSACGPQSLAMSGLALSAAPDSSTAGAYDSI